MDSLLSGWATPLHLEIKYDECRLHIENEQKPPTLVYPIFTVCFNYIFVCKYKWSI